MQLIAGFYVVRSESKIPRKAFDLLFDSHKGLISLTKSIQDKDFFDWWHYLDVSPLLESGVLVSYAFELGQIVERYDMEAKKAKQKK